MSRLGDSLASLHMQLYQPLDLMISEQLDPAILPSCSALASCSFLSLLTFLKSFAHILRIRCFSHVCRVLCLHGVQEVVLLYHPPLQYRRFDQLVDVRVHHRDGEYLQNIITFMHMLCMLVTWEDFSRPSK